MMRAFLGLPAVAVSLTRQSCTVRATLKEGESPLWVRPGSGENSIRVAIFGLLAGEDEIVAQLIKEAVTVAVEAPAVVAEGAAGVSASPRL